jgi:hypothetical protein
VSLDGFVVIDKAAGCTSHDVVGRARRQLGTRRVGHAGTLDPDATGVLVLGIGVATRLLRFAVETSKVYLAEIALGSTTTTLDASGEVTGRYEMSGVTLEDARRAASSLTGRCWWIRTLPTRSKRGRAAAIPLREIVKQEREPCLGPPSSSPGSFALGLLINHRDQSMSCLMSCLIRVRPDGRRNNQLGFSRTVGKALDTALSRAFPARGPYLQFT